MSRRTYKRRESRFDHIEYRRKVTLADFYAKRLNAISIPYGSFANAAVMGTPAVREGRIKLRDAVPFSERTLARLSKPFTTPVIYFKAQKVGPWNKTIKYAEWLRSIGAAPAKAPRKARLPRKPKAPPMFAESAPEAWRDLPADYERISP